MNSPHFATWWLRPEEVAAVVELDGRRTDLIFESDDGTLWEFRLGKERFGWDHSIHSLAYGTDRAAIDDAVRTKLRELGWTRECWALTRTEQAVLDEATKGRRRQEEHAKRVEELEGVVGNWRMARDIRAYVAEARGMVADAELTIADSPFDRWLKFAAAHADDVDPLAGLRADIARVLREKAKSDASKAPPNGEGTKES